VTTRLLAQTLVISALALIATTPALAMAQPVDLPEPASLSLMALGLVGAALAKRRNRK
jgi:PEP-CTERM motif